MPQHTSVLLDEFCEFARTGLSGNSYHTLWDGTLGLAGHLIAWLKDHPEGKACGSDQDGEMLKLAQERIGEAGFSGRVELAHGNFSENPFDELAPFDVIFLDLGISSLHFDHFDRGMSYRSDAPLDLRMDTSSGMPAYQWLKKIKIEDLIKILYEYGEERFAPRIAKRLLPLAHESEMLTSFDVAEICDEVYPASVKFGTHSKRHPAVKTMQALRIHTNRELERLKEALEVLPEKLSVGGRLIIISFHSLEDRLVKHAFASREKILDTSPTAKSHYKEGDFKVITRKVVVPSTEEVASNPRSRSAKMRVLERLR